MTQFINPRSPAPWQFRSFAKDHLPHGFDGFERVMRLRQAERRDKGIVWTGEQTSRDDWPRAWKHLEPLFADCDPNTINPEIMRQVLADIAQRVSDSEAHCTIKVWRALWIKMAALGYCHINQDRSFLFMGGRLFAS
jgi:hypothetical protein